MILDKKEIREDGSFYLGERKDGIRIYMEPGRLSCGWYWSFGNIGYSREFYHFDSLLDGVFGLDGIEDIFNSFVLKENDLWKFADLMKSFYTLQRASEIYYRGGSHYCSFSDPNLKDDIMYKRINKSIKKCIDEAEKMLTPKE